MSPERVKLQYVNQPLDKLTDLLKRVDRILGPQGSGKWVWCNERDEWEVIDGNVDLHSPDLYLYSGPSLTEALEKLLEGVK